MLETILPQEGSITHSTEGANLPGKVEPIATQPSKTLPLQIKTTSSHSQSLTTLLHLL